MATLTTQQMLDGAHQALYRLSTGQAASVIVDRDGQRIEYHKADITKLRQYIAELTAAIAGTSTGMAPMGVYF